jgi:hypothetical protein
MDMEYLIILFKFFKNPIFMDFIFYVIYFIFIYDIQHCFICRPSDSTVSEDAGIEPRTVVSAALAVRRSNHSARSHQSYFYVGGDAELELVDSLDPFSEGIVFSVRPPKKSWKNISNLSGGEKTLSSLALVFALHYYKVRKAEISVADPLAVPDLELRLCHHC